MSSGACAVPQIQGDAISNVALPPWINPPIDAIQMDKNAWLPLPAADGNFHAVLDFYVPNGYNGVIWAVGNVVSAAGQLDGSGDFIWQILSNSVPLQDYQNILGSLGLVYQPTRLLGGLRIQSNQHIQFSLQNVSVPVNPGNNIGARLMGWFYSQLYETPGQWSGN